MIWDGMGSMWIIEDVGWDLEALEIVYCTHVMAVEGMADWPEDVLAQWYVEALYEAKMRHHWILPGYDHVFRWAQLTQRGNEVKSSRFVNQSNINKLDFDLTQIGLKYLRKIFR